MNLGSVKDTGDVFLEGFVDLEDLVLSFYLAFVMTAFTMSSGLIPSASPSNERMRR